MRSSGSIAAVAAIAAAAALHAQGSPEAAYRALLAREAPVRADLAAGGAAAAVLPPVHALVSDYDAMSRTYRTSGYADNALWQGAMLAADAYRAFGRRSDAQTARQLFRSLRDRFPSSSLIARIPEQLTLLDARASAAAAARAQPKPGATPPPGASRDAAATKAARPRPDIAPQASIPPARATLDEPAAIRATRSPQSTAGPSTLLAIEREVLRDAVRITLTLERETSFVSQRLDNPARLSIDIADTRVVYSLKDARLTFAEDVVRQIRVGSHQGERTRIVLDLENARRSSVYPMYNPYRLIVDIERTAAARPTGAVLVADTETRPSSGAAPRPASAARSAGGPDAGSAAPSPAREAAANVRTTAPALPSANGAGGFSLSRQLGLGVARIVIDPGHGGHDPGARAGGLTEAELVLDVALKLEALLAKKPGVGVVLTRRTSTFIPLEERTQIANQANADLFLSIHANASPNSSARGIETYFLNFAPNPEAEAIAARENAGSARTMGSLPEIVRAIALNNKIDESRDFAGFVQKALYAGLRRTNRQARNLGVKQAPFQVLIGATMPSILAEISFITNGQEGGLLKTDAYRSQIAQALMNGVMAYQQSLKRSPAVAATR